MSAENLDGEAAPTQSSSPDVPYGQTKKERILQSQYLGVPGSRKRRSSLESSFSELSELSFLSDEIRNARPQLAFDHADKISLAPIKGFKGHVRSFWIRNKGMLLVLASMFFGSGMNIGTRLLETPGPHGAPMHPYQILFVRQSITATCCTVYGMWSGKIPDFPFGPPKIRWLLVARGLCGFFGVFGFYFSLIYLPLAEATVLTFLGPILTCYVYSLTIPGEKFSKQQQLAGFLSLGGVIFIALSANVSSSSTPLAPDSQGHAVPSKFDCQSAREPKHDCYKPQPTSCRRRNIDDWSSWCCWRYDIHPCYRDTSASIPLHQLLLGMVHHSIARLPSRLPKCQLQASWQCARVVIASHARIMWLHHAVLAPRPASLMVGRTAIPSMVILKPMLLSRQMGPRKARSAQRMSKPVGQGPQVCYTLRCYSVWCKYPFFSSGLAVMYSYPIATPLSQPPNITLRWRLLEKEGPTCCSHFSYLKISTTRADTLLYWR